MGRGRNDVARVKDLAEAISVQVKTTNRTWLATVTLSVVLLLPSMGGAEPAPVNVSLPWGLGEVPRQIFFPIGFSILAAMTVALAAAHANNIRAHEIARRVLRGLPWTDRQVVARDWLDIMSSSTLTRVAPVAQLILGRYQWANAGQAAPEWRRLLSTLCYLALKILATAVLFFLPAAALWFMFWQALGTLPPGSWLRMPVAGAGIVAGTSLAIVVVADWQYVRRIIDLFWTGTQR